MIAANIGKGWGKLQRWLLALSLFPFVVAAIWLLLSGRDAVRYSADHDGTRPLWLIWLPALIGIALVRLCPPRLAVCNPLAGESRRAIAIGAGICTALAIVFAVALPLVREGVAAQLWFIGLKLVLLVVLPIVAFRLLHSGRVARKPPGTLGKWRWLGPVAPVAAWFALVYIGPLAPPASDSMPIDLATVIVVFLINAVLEEVFYRVWLQTRLEAICGRWAGIAIASLLWALWHIALQGTGALGADLAAVIANQGVQGLFLGYLWSRYRNVWALILIHGAINAPLSLLAAVSF